MEIALDTTFTTVRLPVIGYQTATDEVQVRRNQLLSTSQISGSVKNFTRYLNGNSWNLFVPVPNFSVTVKPILSHGD